MDAYMCTVKRAVVRIAICRESTLFTRGEMRARYQQTTDAGRKEAAVISLPWENKRLIDFVMLSSSVSEYSSGITSQQNRSHPVHADM